MEHESLDPIEGPMGRVRALLSEYYEHRRRIRGFLPLLPPLPEIFRARSARLHCRFASVATGCTAGVVEAAGSILAVFAVVAAMGAGAMFAKPTPNLNATFVGAQSARAAATSVAPSDGSLSGGSSSEAPVGTPESSIETAVSTSDLGPDAPLGVEGATEIKRGIAIGLSKEWVVRVGDQNIKITDGTLLWLNCDPRSIALTTACNTYDKAPPETKKRRDPPEVNSPNEP